MWPNSAIYSVTACVENDERRKLEIYYLCYIRYFRGFFFFLILKSVRLTLAIVLSSAFSYYTVIDIRGTYILDITTDGTTIIV